MGGAPEFVLNSGAKVFLLKNVVKFPDFPQVEIINYK